MAIPKPGKPVRGSKSGVPVMAVFDLLGRRWAMGIVWQLSVSENGVLSFSELQKRCMTISPTILSKRIKDLIEAGLVERTLDGYTTTDMGKKLFELLKPIEKWANDWAKNLE